MKKNKNISKMTQEKKMSPEPQKTYKTKLNYFLNWTLILCPVMAILSEFLFPSFFYFITLLYLFIICLFLKLLLVSSSKNKKSFFNFIVKCDFILFIISSIALPIMSSIFPAIEVLPGLEETPYPVVITGRLFLISITTFFILSAFYLLKKLFVKKRKTFYITSIILSALLGIIGYQIYEYTQKPSLCEGCFDKPIIYLYPTKTTEVSVKVGNPQNFTHTYPKYNDGWQVVAQPNGDLTDVKTGRSLYALYWEGEFKTSQPPLEGFIVKGQDTIPFLEEKLAILGLSEREANEMIIYWLPQLENNAYNFIRFQSLEEQNARMPLIIEPKPDTLIRVMMEFDDLDKPIEVTEQILPPTPTRNGFTVVEWGGREVDID